MVLILALCITNLLTVGLYLILRGRVSKLEHYMYFWKEVDKHE